MAGRKRKEPEIVFVADYKSRFVWLECSNPFTSSTAEGIIRMLKKLDRISHEPIIFYIRGIGGDMYAFTRLAHVIEGLRSPVGFIAFDFVRSGCFWITQCGDACFAIAGTKFTFHRAVVRLPKKVSMSQADFLKGLDRLKLVDAIQFWLFTRRGSPVSAISDLFEKEATISTKKATKLRLLKGIYNKKSFEKDRKRAKKLCSKKYNL